jgi:hypothetical protein
MSVKARVTSRSQTNDANGFTLNSGPRNLNYIGKSMRNSTIRTPFKGVYPVNYNTNKQQTIIFAACAAKIELCGQAPTVQKSVRNTRSMLRTKYKWLYGGVYPQTWVQPSENMSSGEHTQIARIEAMGSMGADCACIDGYADGSGPVNCATAFGDVNTQLNHNPIQRLKRMNTCGKICVPLETMSSSDHISRVYRKCILPNHTDKPFPYFTTNPGTRVSGMSGIGPVEMYSAAPDWYSGTQ